MAVNGGVGLVGGSAAWLEDDDEARSGAGARAGTTGRAQRARLIPAWND
jgi:hypothetical protein